MGRKYGLLNLLLSLRRFSTVPLRPLNSIFMERMNIVQIEHNLRNFSASSENNVT